MTASSPADYLAQGLDHLRANDRAAARAAFEAGLNAADALNGEATAADVVELHFRLGNLAMEAGDLDTAEAHYKQALRIDLSLVAAWCNLGNVLQQRGRAADALPYYEQALKRDPEHVATRFNLARALIAIENWGLARPLVDGLLSEMPASAESHFLLGRIEAGLHYYEPALRSFEMAVGLNPSDPESLYWLASMRQELGDEAGALAAYGEAQRLRPLIAQASVKSPPDFTVLALQAPFGGNTPTEYLFFAPDYAVNTYAVLPGAAHDIALLQAAGDIVVNLVSDADQAAAILPEVVALTDRLGKTTINAPSEILRTTRDGTVAALAGLPHVRVPRSVRVPAGASGDRAALDHLLPGPFPVLARPAGTHGGDDFEPFDNLDELAAFLAEHPLSDHYLIEYIEYKSADGHYRKYRFIFIEGAIFPYHLAIGDTWKVHHVNTDMINQRWMQDEEAAFLDDPTLVFSPENVEGLRRISRAFDLSYFGVDCGLTPDGELVVFEVNASMLVHQHNEDMPYKTPHVARIKAAFDAMLRKNIGRL
jgi:tetratricopeptide (TPR) repeat protein